MKIFQSKLQGCYVVQSDVFVDDRGVFSKTYHQDIFKENGLNFSVKEQFYSVSNKHVLRGMHFQLPPHDHIKLVSCLSGSVLDVVLDLRKSSDTYKNFDVFDLRCHDGKTVYIPSGMAHGFLSLEDNSTMLYSTSSVHAPEFDSGIHWSSFGFNWRGVKPITSERDRQHSPLDRLKGPL